MQVCFVNKSQINRANEVDLKSFLMRHGEKIAKSGTQFEWLRESGKVVVRGNRWYDFYEQVGGYPIAFVKKYYGLDFQHAVLFLLDEQNSEDKELKLPEPSKSMTRTMSYLTDVRGLDSDILQQFISEGMIYESKVYHNVIFVGKDKEGAPAHAHRRSVVPGKTYMGNVAGSNASCSFNRIGTSDSLYVFESPIDMLSYITMNKQGWTKHSYVACCGVCDKPIMRILEEYPHIKTVFLCLDNDVAGREATNKIADKLFANGLSCEVLVPMAKDWNEDLIRQIKNQKG